MILAPGPYDYKNVAEPKRTNLLEKRKQENPHKVVKVLRHAVMNTAPLIRYRPGWQSSLFFFPLSMLPAWIADYILIKSNNSKVDPAGLIEQQN